MIEWNFANSYLFASIVTSLFFIALYFLLRGRIK